MDEVTAAGDSSLAEYECRGAYALDRCLIRLPEPPNPPPSSAYLEWHGDTVFRG